MKNLIREKISKAFTVLFGNKWIWKIYAPIAEINAELYLQRKTAQKLADREKFFEKYRNLISNEVKSGPFKGLKYPFMEAKHSMIFPKLLGYYENEIHEVFHSIRNIKFHSIIDVGCAEGYYAVGMALIFPDTKICAADIDPEAREKTRQMAEFNNISVPDQVEIISEINPEFLLALDPEHRYFIFSDCEGYEETLFSKRVVSHLKESYFLIEIHDFVSLGLGDRLKNRFAETHRIQSIQSTDDIFRYRKVQDPELKNIPGKDLKILLEEKRPTQMEWLFCVPLNG
ncbi:MAG: hypothetical protein LPK25_01245 [Cyclobacteriaceae bacterium]|mgnify:CR=1 FL=1|nr:hypothetical protein [Cyclobacteriaceae bacterium]MDX5465444.1 hypothetical protein [Cyclobacteriaceae bacterium]